MLKNSANQLPSNTEKVVKELIDIYWSDIYNSQVIEETIEAAANLPIPQTIQKFINSMDSIVKSEIKVSPLYVIEPYGDALEKLNPGYYSEKRRVFYQEDMDSII
ncbi:hypothetical protein LIS77_26215 (plasmid) [Cytobacillus firmus]|uniref:Uncharacterized protein n=2 Tax=Cytobacillus TaxID=2675230 RepID=A0AA46Q255_CYTFI|nr:MULTISPECIES: hypothetical protein [Cytobacillus]AND43156.1 hypothetical protein A361_28765 [Cytobacillus oceanisediminis 2691]MCM3245595.1 hypothetical protein [Cytobacillus oceanisediminis]UQX57078.1 hypothetical protein M5V91_28430 [Cytobacillus pseudoceanisediminis]USK41667.1 hypothetical protein LIS77_26215 [Cytobacillus firmus]USK47294.1 hypothetical protein LIT27_29390 [Cytobacillus oceanisediminis]